MRQILFIVMFLLICVSPADAAFFGLFGDSAENVSAGDDGQVILDVSGIGRSKSRHYRYNEGKTSVKFFIVRDSQGTVRAAVDACEVCWKAGKGYVMKDGTMFCLNCERRFPLNRIGIITGGCNPHPLKFDLKNPSVIISTKELLLGAKYFPGNAQ